MKQAIHRIRFLIGLVELISASAVLAGTGLSFLEVPVGARESALGGVGAAMVTGPTSAVYNPAAVAFSPRAGVALMHTQHFGDTKAEFIGFTLLPGKLAISPHFWGTRVPDIEYRTSPTRQAISTFDATAEAVGSAFGLKLSERVAAGATLHYLHQKTRAEGADGWAVDAGVIGKPAVNGLTLGAAVNHLGKMSAFVEERPKLPTTLRAGAAYEKAIGKAGTVMLIAEGQGVRDNTPLYRAGAEWRAPDYIALRAGYVAGLDTQDFSVGFGIHVRQFRVDYAFIPYRENLGDGHRFSFAFDL
ncbi:PorV/PorQ family protein [candidate division KSB1 bacterium]|nr:PorV/PorQ family protein [candidate division KSB1 bacterium]